MNKRWFFRLIVLMTLFAVLSSGTIVNGYLTEDGREAEMIRIERSFESMDSKVGRVEKITYHITGDTIVHDPPKEIALVVDVSGSMAWDVNGGSRNVATANKRITILKNAVASFVSKWEDRNCKICIVPFSNYVTQAPELISMTDSDCLTKLNSIISRLTPLSGTNIGDGMRVAYHTLDQSGDNTASKYIITLTDGEPNIYTVTSGNRNAGYYTGSDIMTSTERTQSSDSRGLEYCTSIIGNMIYNNAPFKSFVIGFATPANLVSNLNRIGTSSGAASLDNGNSFYYAGSQSELNQVYSDISDIISADIPFTSAVFSELLPEGTIVEPEAASIMEKAGYEIINNYVDPANPDGPRRTKITKSLSGSLFLTRKYPEATSAPKNRIYQLKPFSFSIEVVYTTPGTKVYRDVDANVIYDDPLEYGADIKYCKTTKSISVIQPVTGIANTHAIVMVGQNEDTMIQAKVLPDTPPNIAYDKMIASWNMTEAKDVTNAAVDPGTILRMESPAVPDALNGTRVMKGQAAGKVYIEAVSSGADLDGAVVKGTSIVFVVDGKVKNAHMNNGDQIDLNNLTVKYIPVTNTSEVKAEYMSFGNWRLKNASDDAAFITVSPTGTAKAIQPLVGDIPVQVDVTYMVGTPGSSDYLLRTKTTEMVIQVAQPVTGVTVTGTTVMAGSESKVTAVVDPSDALNRKIKEWRLYDAESGNDVTNTGTIATLSSTSDPNLCEMKVRGGNWGKVIVEAESEGNNLSGVHVFGSSMIYVVDAVCPGTLSMKLWTSDKIEPESHIPEGVTGSIRYTFTSNNPSAVSVDTTGKVKALQTTTSPVAVRIRAEYHDSGGNPTGQVKELVCMVSVEKPKIDIN